MNIHILRAIKSAILPVLAMLLHTPLTAKAASDFNTVFCDSTLRIDYIFSGNAKSQNISLDKLNMSPRWYGKRARLAELPIEGNGQITVRDHATHEIVYRNSFSTLFQEWLTYDEAKTTTKAFENVFLIPMPKRAVDVTIDLRNNRHETTTTMTHTVDPSDILIRHIGFDGTTPYVTLQAAGDTTRCINIAYVAEGYRKEEMNTFLDDARIATDALFEHEPFKSRRGEFNIIAVESASKDTGTSIPSQGIWKNTVLGSHFDTFYSNRYLTTLNLKDLHDVLAGTPYEHIIVLVNTAEYGGGGILNSYNLSMTHHPQYRKVVVHEFGHSFAGLADEYAYDFEPLQMYPVDVEPWEKNITTLVDFNGKWEKLIDKKTPLPTPADFTMKGKGKKKVHPLGAYEGAGYCLKGVYRPSFDCRMRSNEHPEFCPACQKALNELIDFYTK